MPGEFTYAKAGVDRELRAKSKESLDTLIETYKFSKHGKVIQLPYGNLFPVGDKYLDLVIEGVGTKVLLAQLADKYDTIGLDGVAMAVNDVIRSGAKPIAVSDNIHAQASDPIIIKQLIKGIKRGAKEAECIVPSGEIGDVKDLIRGVTTGKGFDMVVACIGEVSKENIIFGSNLKAGDFVVGLRSSGIHSNGVTLARRVLFKEWGGKYGAHDIPDGLDRELIYEALEPTKIYVKPFSEATKKAEVKGAVHITGDAYLKFGRLMLTSKKAGFRFHNFKPQPIFSLIQKTAEENNTPITNEEMFKTFNMGWGFALVVDEADTDVLIQAFRKSGVESEPIGEVTDTGKIVVEYGENRISMKSGGQDLNLRHSGFS